MSLHTHVNNIRTFKSHKSRQFLKHIFNASKEDVKQFLIEYSEFHTLTMFTVTQWLMEPSFSVWGHYVACYFPRHDDCLFFQ